MLVLRASCRVTVHSHPRDHLRASTTPYVFPILHAHQVSAAINRETNTAAMVSQSGDGQLLLAGFWLLGIKAVRGSNRRMHRDKGGRKALSELTSHVQNGAPAILAVDGPRGPRNRVRKGIAVLSRESGAAVLNVVLSPHEDGSCEALGTGSRLLSHSAESTLTLPSRSGQLSRKLSNSTGGRLKTRSPNWKRLTTLGRLRSRATDQTVIRVAAERWFMSDNLDTIAGRRTANRLSARQSARYRK